MSSAKCETLGGREVGGEGLEKEDQKKFRVILGYIVSSKLAWPI